MKRRTLIQLAAGAAASAALPAAFAQSYPAKQIRFVVPFPAGGATDIYARALAQKLTETLGQSVVVDNKPGAGGAIGSEIVVKSAPDGHTILLGTVSTHSIGPALNAKMPYDPVKDFTPVIHLADATNVLLVSPTLQVNNVRELIAYAKANPGRLNYGSSGVGTISHLAGEQFKMATGTFIVLIPYKGTGLVIPDLISGQISLLFDNIASALPHIKSGKVKTFALSQLKRLAILPDIPTMDESGVKGFESSSYFGVFAPPGTPGAIVQKLNADINKILTMTDFRERLASLGGEPAGGTPEALTRLIVNERKKFADVIKRAGIKPE